jgi:multidrug efflux pump
MAIVMRLGDVAKVERASNERRAWFRSNGEPNVGLGIIKTSTANSLDVAREPASRPRPNASRALPEGTRRSSSPSTAPCSSTTPSSASTTLFEATRWWCW